MPFGGQHSYPQKPMSASKTKATEPIFPNSPVYDPYSHRRGLRSSSNPRLSSIKFFSTPRALSHHINSNQRPTSSDTFADSSPKIPNEGNAILSLLFYQSLISTPPTPFHQVKNISGRADLCGGRVSARYLSSTSVFVFVCKEVGREGTREEKMRGNGETTGEQRRCWREEWKGRDRGKEKWKGKKYGGKRSEDLRLDDHEYRPEISTTHTVAVVKQTHSYTSGGLGTHMYLWVDRVEEICIIPMPWDSYYEQRLVTCCNLLPSVWSPHLKAVPMSSAFDRPHRYLHMMLFSYCREVSGCVSLWDNSRVGLVTILDRCLTISWFVSGI